MPRVSVIKVALSNLRGLGVPGQRGYLPRERAREILAQCTGQDFGDDADAWQEWIAENGYDMSKLSDSPPRKDREG